MGPWNLLTIVLFLHLVPVSQKSQNFLGTSKRRHLIEGTATKQLFFKLLFPLQHMTILFVFQSNLSTPRDKKNSNPM